VCVCVCVNNLQSHYMKANDWWSNQLPLNRMSAVLDITPPLDMMYVIRKILHAVFLRTIFSKRQYKLLITISLTTQVNNAQPGYHAGVGCVITGVFTPSKS